ncbi:serine/threonine-protein kinase [Nocardiopsis trehalosi]|jgi:predicted Ser/Thr protein kinase|uniref:serine/threonine-protein kinase n=1 Tax=Nocardiopsis trehalosi TaxID=109329 RepID=UPI000835C3D0|nr:serine/threonine-protein kinase [Nocardiopsis trehalosi]
MAAAGPLTEDDPRRIGTYTLTGRLGQGGQGVVYLGAGADGEVVAVKTLHADGLDAAGLRRQLAEEIDTARRVARFCTAQVLAADVDADPPYVVSEYIEGPTLRESVLRDGPLRGAALERLAIGTLTAIAAIHQAGIVHRDFKPGNVLMGPDGPRVIDFGIARALEGTAILTSRIAGTPAYMAPEQIGGGAMGPPVDLFAWGATMVYAANGHGPFNADSMQAVLQRVIEDEPDLGALDGALRDIAVSCLDKDPARRPTAAESLMRVLGVDPGTAAAVSGARAPEDPAPALPVQTLVAGVVAAAAPEAQERAAAEVYRSHPELPPGPSPVPRPQAPPTGPQFGPQGGPAPARPTGPQFPAQGGPRYARPGGPPPGSPGGPPPEFHSGPYPGQSGAPAPGGWAPNAPGPMPAGMPGQGGPQMQPNAWESGPQPHPGTGPGQGYGQGHPQQNPGYDPGQGYGQPGPGYPGQEQQQYPTGPGPAYPGQEQQQYPTGPGPSYGGQEQQQYPTGPGPAYPGQEQQQYPSGPGPAYPGQEQGYAPGAPQGYGPDQGFGPQGGQQWPAGWQNQQGGQPQQRGAGTGLVVGLIVAVVVLLLGGIGLLAWAFLA